ncbi:hypothetical protein [Rhizobium tropici]|uniref:hypothetical protein n=1 Tax=Rhizobium tropici TaxID=398 RepID=UPI00165F2EFC|nr:hypothetical protein [Rhizobium tropici]
MDIADDIGGHVKMLEPLSAPTRAEAISHFFAYPGRRHETAFRAHTPERLNYVCKKDSKATILCQKSRNRTMIDIATGQGLRQRIALRQSVPNGAFMHGES